LFFFLLLVLQHYPPSSRAILRAIVEEEGMRGLFKGIVPRTAKVAPACALMIASYEFFKQLFLEPPP
jgi:solute carrier family 25 protein 39/40